MVVLTVSQLQPMLETMLTTVSSANAFIGLELSLVGPGKSISAAAGFACSSPPCFPAQPVSRASDVFCFGSATKLLTTVAVLSSVQQGMIRLDDLAEPLIHRFLTNSNNRNISLRARLGPEVSNVTVRHLASMRSGVPDYDTAASRQWQLAHPTVDIDPIMILERFVTPGFSFAPGTHGEYSTTNFVLLGLVLAGAKGLRRWEDLDQITALPPAAAPLLSHSSFPRHGACNEVGHMVHGLTLSEKGLPVDTCVRPTI